MRRCYGCMKEYSEKYDVCPYCGYIVDTEPEVKSHLIPGTKLAGRFVVGKAIGHGGFGITYIAWDEKIRKVVAIKEYFPNAFSTRSAGETQVSCFNTKGEAFLREGVAKMLDEAKRLSVFSQNDNIVDISDYFEENNTAYIVMEYLEGRDLKKHLEENGGKLAPETSVEIILPVLNALEDMHKANLIHRDVSPDNIFICDNGKVKLLDFGSARLAVEDSDKSLSVMVKRGYAPREQYASRAKQGPWTDVYAVCATLYRMITGQTPSESTEREDESLISFSEYGITGYESFEKVIFKGLEVDYKDRIGSIQELRAMLTNAENNEPVPVAEEPEKLTEDKPAPEQPVITDKPKSKLNIKAIIAAVAAVVVIVAGVVAAVKFIPDKKPDTAETTTATVTEEVELTLNASEAEKIYEKFLASEELKETYPDIHAIKTKDISSCSPEYAEYLEMSNVETLSSAVIDMKYYDLDSDGINEMLLSTDVDGDEFYVDLYLFDIDVNGKVFEGGSFLRLMPSRCFDHIAVMQNTESKYYFVRYTNDGQHSKSCEKLVYNGRSIKSEFSLFAGNPNLEPGYGTPEFIKATGNNSAYLYDEEVNDNKLSSLTYKEYISEWETCFNNKHITGYCDDNWDEQAEIEVVKELKSGQVTITIDWILYETGLLCLNGNGKMPDYLDMYDITPHDFRPWNDDGEYTDEIIKEVVISEGVTNIGDYAFAYCTQLESVIFPESLKTIGNYSFAYCNKLANIQFHEGIISIGSYAFENCESIVNLDVPASITTIGDNAFSCCDNLEEITVNDNNKCYSSDEYGVLFNKDKTELLQYPIGNSRKSYTIPDGVKTIGESAFWSCESIENIVIPNGVIFLGKFGYCVSLKSITIPDSVTDIGYQAFDVCDSLADVYYTGSIFEWRAVSIDEKNEALENAKIHYNS